MTLDRLFVARVLPTFATIGYSLLTVRADFKRRMQLTTVDRTRAIPRCLADRELLGFGAIALWLICVPGAMAIERLYLASAFAVVVYGAFFIALLCMPVCGGRAYDDNGYLPFAVGRMKWDANVTAFSVMTALLAASAALVAAG